MSSPSRRGMDEVWTSGRGMPISRTKVGERSSVDPGENASNEGSISLPRLDEVDPLPFMPNEQGF